MTFEFENIEPLKPFGVSKNLDILNNKYTGWVYVFNVNVESYIHYIDNYFYSNDRLCFISKKMSKKCSLSDIKNKKDILVLNSNEDSVSFDDDIFYKLEEYIGKIRWYNKGKLENFKTWNGNKCNEDTNPFEFLKEYNIVFNNVLEARHILKILKELNFTLYENDPIDREIVYWGAMVKGFKNDFCLGKPTANNNPQITYEEFIKITNNDGKIKRILKPDIDPFGEEDWGYEIVESNGGNIIPTFEIGDIVEVNGIVGSRNFKGETGEITKINLNGGVNRGDMKLDGVGNSKDRKYYYGAVYYISSDDINYWVSPWNMTKMHDNQIKNKDRIRWYKNGKLE